MTRLYRTVAYEPPWIGYLAVQHLMAGGDVRESLQP
jgi:hypothetical protein